MCNGNSLDKNKLVACIQVSLGQNSCVNKKSTFISWVYGCQKENSWIAKFPGLEIIKLITMLT